jgi:hypothetical protein
LYAADMLTRSIEKVQSLRNSFTTVETEATNLARAWGINEQIRQRRVGKVPRMFDEFATMMTAYHITAGDSQLMCLTQALIYFLRS